MSSSTWQILLQFSANRTGTNIHPNNGVVERTTSGFAPKHSGLSLVSQPNCLQPFVHVVAILCCLFHCLCNTSPHTLQNLHWIMLHPSGFWVQLSELNLVRPNYASWVIID